MRFVASASSFFFLALLAGCGAAITPGDGGARPDSGTGSEAAVLPEAGSTDAIAPPPTDAISPTIDVVPPPPDVVPPPPDAVPPGDVVIPPRDSGFPVSPDGAVVYPPDAGYDPGVMCGTSVCTGTQVCCVNTMTRMLSCTAPGACMGPSATCDGPEDCPSSQTCCLTGMLGAGGTGGMLSCSAASSCTRVPVVGSITPCHTPADCPRTAAMCCNVSGFSGFGVMLPPGIPSICSPFCP